jgi:hypothetical protein
MGIAEEYAKRVKTPIIRVTITTFMEGQKPGLSTPGYDWYPEVISCDISYGLDQGSTTCSLLIKNPLNVDGTYVRFRPMNRVKVEQGWNVSSTYRTTFFGFVDEVILSNPPNEVRLECRDILKLAQDNYYIQTNRRVYSSVADPSELDEDGNPMGGQAIVDRQVQTILTDFMMDSGISESRLFFDFVEYPASGAIIIGNNATAVFVYESAMDASIRVCDLIGYRLWADKSGNVQCREVRPVASTTPAVSYRSQIDTYVGNETWVTTQQGNLLSVQASKDDDLRNWIEVIGYGGIKSTVVGESDYVPTPPTYRRTEIRSYLLDTPELVTAVASRVYTDLNRLRYTARASIEGDPRLELGQTVQIYDPYATEAPINYFLYDYSSSFKAGNWTMDLNLVGGAGDDLEGSEPVSNVSPVALFTSRVEREFLSNGVVITDVSVDGSPSYDPDGDEADLSYTWVCSGYANKYGVKQNYTVSGDDVQALVVTLLVQDSGTPPLSNSFAKTIVFPTVSGILWKTIFVATASEVWVTDTGGASWSHRELY